MRQKKVAFWKIRDAREVPNYYFYWVSRECRLKIPSMRNKTIPIKRQSKMFAAHVQEFQKADVEIFQVCRTSKFGGPKLWKLVGTPKTTVWRTRGTYLWQNKTGLSSCRFHLRLQLYTKRDWEIFQIFKIFIISILKFSKFSAWNFLFNIFKFCIGFTANTRDHAMRNV